MTNAPVIREFTILAASLRFPEGPVWLSDGAIAVVEIGAGCVTRIGMDGSVDIMATPGGGPNGLAVGPDNSLYVCNNGGLTSLVDSLGRTRLLQWREDEPGRIERIDIRTGEVAVLYEACGTRRLSAPSDIVFDREGGFYFTDIGKTRDGARAIGALYYAQPDGSSIHEVAGHLLAPNGVGLSPDGSELYVTETETCRLWAWKVAAPGVLEHRPETSHGGRFVAGPSGFRHFDGLAVDVDGNIIVGTLLTGEITSVAPDGRILGTLEVPDLKPTNVCFGGATLRTVFVTLADRGALASVPWDTSGAPLAFSM